MNFSELAPLLAAKFQQLPMRMALAAAAAAEAAAAAAAAATNRIEQQHKGVPMTLISL